MMIKIKTELRPKNKVKRKIWIFFIPFAYYLIFLIHIPESEQKNISAENSIQLFFTLVSYILILNSNKNIVFAISAINILICALITNYVLVVFIPFLLVGKILQNTSIKNFGKSISLPSSGSFAHGKQKTSKGEFIFTKIDLMFLLITGIVLFISIKL